ncbi:MAG: hypothetical protein FuLiV2_gp3 [Hangzhou lispivirus 1]|uniref:Uncharacterized protein n=1 Tax=Hangzhou lispivirus 1 TaxID=2905568 RepID=A0A8K1XHS8_9MONO|nr:MAG: hypothetical protein FuLiV2_gp3 [Hangzhou lispivirus 1]
MSILGIKIYVTDAATALSCLACPILFYSEIPPQGLPKDNIKTLFRSGILSVDVWWCGKPYVKFTLDKEVEKMMTSQFKFKRFSGPKKEREIAHYLIDICDVTKESPARLFRAKDIECSVESVFITENCFERAVVIKEGTFL